MTENMKVNDKKSELKKYIIPHKEQNLTPWEEKEISKLYVWTIVYWNAEDNNLILRLMRWMKL